MPDQTKANLLVITLSPPLPANSGAPIYVTNTLLPLATKYNLHLFTFGGEAEKQNIRKHQAEYDRYFRSTHVEERGLMPIQKSYGARISHAIEHIWCGLPFIDASYYTRRAVANARRIVKDNDIQLIEIHSSHLAFFKRFLPSLPALLVSHNIESDLFPFWIPLHLSPWKRAIAEFVAGISRRNAHAVEIDNKWRFGAMTFISKRDMDRVTAAVEKQYIPLCLPVSDIDYETKPREPVRLLWMGSFNWYPNAEGILWFVREILPLVRDKLAPNQIQVHILGSSPPDELKACHDDKTVFVHGYVDDLQQVLIKTHLLFVPLLSGGGVRVKILEAMSNGIPVLSTNKGCEGLNASDGVDIVVRDQAAEFAAALLQLATDREQRARLSIACRELLDRQFNLQHCLATKDRIYQQLLASSGRGALRGDDE